MFFILASYWKYCPPEPYSPLWCFSHVLSFPSFLQTVYIKFHFPYSVLICFIPQTFHHFVSISGLVLSSIFFYKWGLQSWTQHSKFGLTKVLYRGIKTSFLLLVTLLVIHPKIRFALLTAKPNSLLSGLINSWKCNIITQSHIITCIATLHLQCHCYTTSLNCISNCTKVWTMSLVYQKLVVSDFFIHDALTGIVGKCFITFLKRCTEEIV